MGLAKTVKEALLRPFRSTNVQHFGAGSGSTKKHVGSDRGKIDAPPAAKTQPAPSRSAWKRKSKRKATFLTPVPEEKEEQIAEEKVGKAPRSEAAYMDNASGIGLDASVSSTQTKRTHILIDLRELTKAINDPDGEFDGSDDDVSSHCAQAMPPSQYLKRNGLRMGRSAARNMSIASVKATRRGHGPSALASTQPIHARTRQQDPAAGSGRQYVSDASTMAMLDDIMQSETKLDVPYLTRENVDTSLPGSTTVSQRADAEQRHVVRPLVVPNDFGRSSIREEPSDDDDGSCGQSTPRPQPGGGQMSYPSQATIQIQRSKSFAGHDSISQSPMKMFRKHNVTDITVHDVTSAGILISGDHVVSSTSQAGRRATDSSQVAERVEGERRVTPVRATKPVIVDDQITDEAKPPEPKAEVKKEVKFAADGCVVQEIKPVSQAKPTASLLHAPASGSLMKPVLTHSSPAIATEQPQANVTATEAEKDISIEEATVCQRHGFVRSKSARTYRSIDLSQKSPKKDVLPKTSFFSCHEKSLTEAGYNVKELEKAARMVRIKRSHSKKAKDGQSRCSPPANDRPKAAYKVHVELKRSRSFMSLTKGSRRRHKSKSSDDGDDYGDSQVAVDPAPLLRYLQLVVDRPAEYASMRDGAASFTRAATPSGHQAFDSLRRARDGSEARQRTDSLIELNRAFRKCQENFSPPESLVLRALNELGNKRWHSHPICAKFEAYRKAKYQLAKTKRHPLIHNRDNVTHLSNGAGSSESVDPSNADVQLTELEKARGEVEQWFKTLNMAQVIRAKEIALRAFGEEEESFSHWWNTNKHCRYIRQAVAAE